MKAAAVEHELERIVGWRCSEKVHGSEAATERASLQFGVGSFDGEWRDIHSENVETVLGQPNGIRTAPISRARVGATPARSDELNEQRLWLSGVPGRLS